MFNFRMNKSKQEKILQECNFNELEKFIFNNLVEGKSRLETYELVKNNYNRSESTTARTIRKIIEKINNYNYNVDFKHKVYIHKFPNGKKYVGVCKNCEDRWANGKGYAYNKKMYDDIQKYGWDNIEHKILFEVSDSKIAYDLERVLIDELDLVNVGYNNE